MTRKKIDLGLATDEWLIEHFGDRLPFSFREIAGWKEDGEHQFRHKRDRLTAERQRHYLSAALELSVDHVSASTNLGISFQTGDTLDAKDLNRLMNSEIHLDGKVMVFESIDAAGHMEGDSYMGEWNEYAVHRIEVRYRAKG